MSLSLRTPINDLDVLERLDNFEYIQSQLHSEIMEIPQIRDNLRGKYHAEIIGELKELTDISLNQLLGIGKFAKRSFTDALRVKIPNDTNHDLNAGIYMLNSIKDFADKSRYKFQSYDDMLVSVNNPNYPNFDTVKLFTQLYNKFSEIGLIPTTYDLSFDPVSGRQSIEVVFGDLTKRTNLRLNETIGVGVKITNSITGQGHFTIQIYAVQLVCTNGMIAPVSKAGIKILHRSEFDMIKKFRTWIGNVLGYNVHIYQFDDMFFTHLVNAIIKCARDNSDLISDALERARTKMLDVSPKDYFEILQKKYVRVSKKDAERMISLYYMDDTLDRPIDQSNATNSLVNIVQTVSRYANEIQSPTKREELQELAYQIAVTH